MVDGPFGRKCKTNDSICSEVVEKQWTPVSSVRRSVLPRKKDAQILKENSSHALSTKVLCAKETESARELRSAETRNRSSFSSPTISSSRKTIRDKQKVQVQQIEPRLTQDLVVSDATKTSQVKDTPVPSRPPLPLPKKISSPLQVTPIQTSIHPSQPTATRTKCSVLQKTSSKPELSHQKTPSKAPILQSKIQTSPTSQPSQKRTLNQNSGSPYEPSKQYVTSSGTQNISVPPQALAGKTTSPASIRQRIISTSTKEPSRIRERYVEHEEPIHHIVWEGPDETFHSSGRITCPICKNDMPEMPDEYADEYYDDVEPSVFPSVAVLSCGHSFHAVCLEGITPEENSSDPPCFFCFSCLS
ncbi:unnamed protein product [Withania somnifera]